MIEGKLDFTFSNNYKVVKFDGTDFYKRYKSMPNGKGVDFILFSDDRIILLEIKDCSGYERENAWRVEPNKITHKNNTYDESFDIEIAKKVSSTFSCLVGVGTYPKIDLTQDMKELCDVLDKLRRQKTNVSVILFLEGDFHTKTYTKTMVMGKIKRQIKKYLSSWISNITVNVIDSVKLPSYIKDVKKIFNEIKG